MTIKAAHKAGNLTASAAPGRAPNWPLVACALGFGFLAIYASQQEMRLISSVAGLTFAALALVLAVRRRLARQGQTRRLNLLRELLENELTPSFLTDARGEVIYRNRSATELTGDASTGAIVRALRDHFSQPSAVLFRLQNRAMANGVAREDLVTRRGHLRLSVSLLGPGNFLWRLEEFRDDGKGGRGAEGISLPMLVANRNGVILFSNEAMRRISGGKLRRLEQLFTSPSLNSGEEVMLQTPTGKMRAILAEVEGLGERREIYLLPMANGAEGASEDPIEKVPVAMVRFAADGAMLTANAAARVLLSLKDEAGARFHDLLEGLGRPVSDWLADVVAARMPARSEVLNLRGGEKFVQVFLSREVFHGRPCAMAILQDATALKQLEAQFAQSQKMQAIGQLAGGIAHDFNNLLTAISGHCDLLLLRQKVHDPGYDDLMQIRQNANRAASLVSQLLAFSRKQTLTPETLDLEDVLADEVHLLNRLVGEKITLEFRHDPNLRPVRADKRQLEQVMMNLVVNARDAMRGGGTIRIETEALELPLPLSRDRAQVPAGSYALIRVRDSGIGIPSDKLQKVFEPFYTTKKPGEGTGLGLSTVYGIVKQSGGFIFVDSEEGVGTTFSIYLPSFEAELQEGLLPAKTESPAKSMTVEGGTILLVEDEAPVRAFASRALRLRGYRVVEAASAEEALDILEDKDLGVDVFVTDVVMPGMDGPSWVRKALEDRPGVRVVFVSGYAEDALSEEQGRIPNSVFLPKPFSLSELAATVQDQMGVQ